MRHGRVDPLAERLDRRPDTDLVAGAAAGDPAAFEELYRRYAAAAWRVAYAVAGNPDDAADSVSDAFTRVFEVLPGGRLADGEFAPYLLAATRNAAIDTLRRSGRLEPTDHIESFDRPAGGPSPFDRVVQGEDSSIVARAFRSLPERWRSVLWMTEVEGIPPREVGARMGLTANTAAQLATRARAGLRERYLQAHLNERVDEDCRFSVERLGAHVAGRLAPRELAKVDQHLAACPTCRGRVEELNDVGATLRRLALPVPALLGHQVVARWRTATAAASTAGTAGTAGTGIGVGAIPETLLRFQKPLLAVSSGLFALGVISASVVGTPGAPFGEARRVIERVPRPAGPLVVEDTLATADLAAPLTEPLDLGFAEPPSAALEPTAAPVRREQPRAAPPPPRRRGTLAGAPGTEVGEPVVTTGVAVALGPVDTGASIGVAEVAGGVPCAGAAVELGLTVGCPPPPAPEPDGIATLAVGGSALGAVDPPAVTIVSPI